jgi:hypothetical protein
MNLANVAIEPVLALLIVPRFSDYFVAVYLIIVAVLGLMYR